MNCGSSSASPWRGGGTSRRKRSRNAGQPRKSSTQRMAGDSERFLDTAAMCSADAPRKAPSSTMTSGRTSSISSANTAPVEPHPRGLAAAGCSSAAVCGGGKLSYGLSPSNSLSRSVRTTASLGIASPHSSLNRNRSCGGERG
ncbi:Os09g0519000 [Oryza sativa Japonica Group]|uniref:Os09g0519000 protein n=1 Tax=Oryza sativa subsp. japonica TaxID=39947 RepID=Q0J0A9_ORYSJ|nr:Os09g0519000 [Oryza sativa Japonica Group]|eukprot:NP_001063692.1 Os09g0519000 [Oryza sativa Japonica Group]